MQKLILVLALSGGVAFAQECPSGCRVDRAPAAVAKVTASTRLAKLTASAEKGCATSKGILASLQREFKADSPEALMQMVTACEQYAGKGCEVSKKVLVKLDGAIAKAKQGKQPVALSVRLTQLDRGCAKGCEKSRTLMATLFKQYEVKDAKALITQVQAWESKAKNGCKSCTTKLATLAAMLPTKKPALSLRLAKMSQGCEAGCEQSKAAMATLLSATKAKDARALIAQVQAWEQKAANGCAKCTTELSNLEARLAPAPATTRVAANTAKKSDGADSAGCTDCAGCPGCPGK